MTETEAKASATSLKARVAKVQATLKATYHHYRHEIAHYRILSNLPPEYRTMLGHAADTINSTCQNAGVQLIPEDVVIILSVTMLMPLSYFTLRCSYLFQLALHTYFVFVYPVMVSLYDAESGDAAGAGSDLVGWVLLSFWTVLERAVPNGVRGYERLWYLVLKCGFAYGLFNPRLDGAAALVKFVVRPRVLPALGIEGGIKATKKGVSDEEKTTSSSSSAATVKSRGHTAIEESDASTQDSKESGFSFVEKSELEQEQDQPESKAVHLKIESIEGTDWKFPAGKTEFEGPYLVFDIVDKHLDETDFLPPSHAETVAGKKVRTPVGILVKDDKEEKEGSIDETTKTAEQESAQKEEKDKEEEETSAQEKEMEQAVEPELEEEVSEKKADEAEGIDIEETEGQGKEQVKEDTIEKPAGGDEEVKKSEESDEKEEKTEKEDEKDESASDEDQEEPDALNPEDEQEEKGSEEESPVPALSSEKLAKTGASFSWPGTALSIPFVLPLPGKDVDGDDSRKCLLRVVAYDKRAIGSDAFFGVAYAVAPLGMEPGGESTSESLVLKDGRAEDKETSVAVLGEVSLKMCQD